MAIVETGSVAAAAPAAVVPRAASRSTWTRFKPTVLALIVPLMLLAFWQVATTQQWTRLIPTPYAVGEYMIDFAVGGIYDDAYSATLTTHLLASMSRVYGGFALAALFALPIGILIGRLPTARMLLDPFLQVMRPIPVTAWLPLSMILFGLGAKSAFALVCLGAPAHADMSFRLVSLGGQGCGGRCAMAIAADGEITDATPDAFLDFVRANARAGDLRSVVLLNSPGGKVVA